MLDKIRLNKEAISLAVKTIYDLFEIYSIKQDLNITSIERFDKKSGLITFNTELVVGQDISNFPLEIDEHSIVIDEMTDMIKVDVELEVSYRVEENEILLTTSNEHIEIDAEHQNFENIELDNEDYLKVYDYYGHDWLNKVDKALNKVNNDEVVDYLKDDYDIYNLYNLNFTKEKVYFQD